MFEFIDLKPTYAAVVLKMNAPVQQASTLIETREMQM